MLETTVFQSGNSVAVRLKGECRLPKGTRIVERREGTRIILEPSPGWPKSFRNSLGSLKAVLPQAPDLEARSAVP